MSIARHLLLVAAVLAQTAPSAPHRVWTTPVEGMFWGHVSPDGRFTAYGNSDDGEIYVSDLKLGTVRRVTDDAASGLDSPALRMYADEWFQFSRDSRYLAYAWRVGDVESLRMVDLHEPGIPRHRVLFDEAGVQWVTPSSWSPDGHSLVFDVTRHDKPGAELRVVSIRDSQSRVIRSVGPDTLIGSAFFSPDGRRVAYRFGPSDGTTGTIGLFNLNADTHGVLISETADQLLGWNAAGLILVRRAPAGVSFMAAPFSDDKAGEPVRITPDLPQVVPAGISIDGTAFYLAPMPERWRMRIHGLNPATNQLLTQAAEITAPNSSAQLFPAAWSKDGTRLVLVSRPAPGAPRNVFIGSAERVVSQVPVQLATIDTVSWAPDDRSLIIVGTDKGRRQGAFRVDAESGETKVVAERVDMIRAWRPDGSRIYFERGADDGTGRTLTIERDVAAGTDRILADGPGGWKARLSRAMSPDGRTLYRLSPEAGGGPLERDLVAIDTASDTQKVLVSQRRMAGLTVSPAGRYLLTAVDGQSMIVPTAGGLPRPLPALDGRSPVLLAWAPDDSGFVAKPARTGPRTNGADTLWWVPMNAGQPRQLGGAFDSVAGVMMSSRHVSVVERLAPFDPRVELWSIPTGPIKSDSRR